MDNLTDMAKALDMIYEALDAPPLKPECPWCGIPVVDDGALCLSCAEDMEEREAWERQCELSEGNLRQGILE